MTPRVVAGMAVVIVMPLILFMVSGDWGWPTAWAYTGLYWVAALGGRLTLLYLAPDLLIERGNFPALKGVPDWDPRLSMVMGMWGPMALLLVAGLDHRLGWSALVPKQGVLMAFGVVGVAFLVSVWAMFVNRFFGAVVRIQTERNHKVVDTGPYAYLRHPGYAGSLYATLAIPFALDALWALIPALLLAVVTIRRTILEDRFLQDQLPGYADYAKRVRIRLIPGLW